MCVRIRALLMPRHEPLEPLRATAGSTSNPPRAFLWAPKAGAPEGGRPPAWCHKVAVERMQAPTRATQTYVVSALRRFSASLAVKLNRAPSRHVSM